MKYSEAQQGRTFVLRLEDGEVIHEVIEAFANEMKISSATVTALGGVDKTSTLVVGPEDGRAKLITPMQHTLDNIHEICGNGTIFQDDRGKPVLHMHISCGRQDQTITGCVRAGVKVWQVLEVIIQELTGTLAKRMPDAVTGFKLLQP